jgi:membrane protease YdiL (CAAX protease family)
MERIDATEASGRRHPHWYRVLLALLIGFLAVQWAVGPLHGMIRPDAPEIERYLVVKGVTLAWIAVVIMRSIGWAAVGFRLPVRPASALYATPFLLLGAASLAGGVASTMDASAFVAYAVIVTIGVLGEEVIFRGVMWEAVATRGHYFTAITTSLGFGMIHAVGFGGPVPNSVVAAMVCFAAGGGMMLAAVRIAAGTLWTAFAVHWVFNMMSFAASGGVTATFPPGTEMRLVGAGVVLGLVGLGAVALAARRSASRGEASGASGAEMPVSQVG